MPADEQVLGAFVGLNGPRPGWESVGCVVLVAVHLATGSIWVAGAAMLALFVGLYLARGYVTVARTDRSVIVFDNGRRSSLRADAVVTRLPVDSISRSTDAPDPYVHVGGSVLWVNGTHQDEAGRLSRLVATTS